MSTSTKKRKARRREGQKHVPKSNSRLLTFDTGADGPAQQARKSRMEDSMETEIIDGQAIRRNPNGVQRRRFAAQADRLAQEGRLSPEQAAAAEDWERITRAVLGGLGRSCLDFTPIGHDDPTPDDEDDRDRQDYRALCHTLGMQRSAELDRVCWRHEPVKRVDLLREGLEIVAGYFGY